LPAFPQVYPQAASTNRQQAVLPQVNIIDVENGQSGELKARIARVENSRGYDGRIKAASGDYGPPISFASSKGEKGSALRINIKAPNRRCHPEDWACPKSTDSG